jgi:lambda repressor-like predicted transcriptional regulator
VQCGKISKDGTKIEGNSGRNELTYHTTLEKIQTRYEDKIEQIVGEADEIDAEEGCLYGDKGWLFAGS